jgi:hypothetical protein
MRSSESAGYAAQTVVIVSSLLFGGLLFRMFVFACLPLFTLVTKGRKAAEYEWRRLWWVK